MEQIKETAGRYPERVVADGGFTNQAAIEGMEELAIEFYGLLTEPEVRQAAAMKAAGIDAAFAPSAFRFQAGSNSLECPAGKQLGYVRQGSKRGLTYHQYQGQRPEQGRLVSIRQTGNAAVAAFREKMRTDAAREIYKQRGPVAECPNAWLKEKCGIRKFRMRGWAKATTEALLGVLTYNVIQWRRLSWRPKIAGIDSFTAARA